MASAQPDGADVAVEVLVEVEPEVVVDDVEVVEPLGALADDDGEEDEVEEGVVEDPDAADVLLDSGGRRDGVVADTPLALVAVDSLAAVLSGGAAGLLEPEHPNPTRQSARAATLATTAWRIEPS